MWKHTSCPGLSTSVAAESASGHQIERSKKKITKEVALIADTEYVLSKSMRMHKSQRLATSNTSTALKDDVCIGEVGHCNAVPLLEKTGTQTERFRNRSNCKNAPNRKTRRPTTQSQHSVLAEHVCVQEKQPTSN